MEPRAKYLLRACLCALMGPLAIRAEEGSAPVVQRPSPVSIAELAGRTTLGVSAVEVHDYAPGHYRGVCPPARPMPI